MGRVALSYAPGTGFEDGRLPGVRLERLALLDAQRLQRGHVEGIVLLHRVVVDDGCESLPELHASRGVVSITAPEIETTLSGFGSSRSLHG
jgi:hypothetical protein